MGVLALIMDQGRSARTIAARELPLARAKIAEAKAKGDDSQVLLFKMDGLDGTDTPFEAVGLLKAALEVEYPDATLIISRAGMGYGQDWVRRGWSEELWIRW